MQKQLLDSESHWDNNASQSVSFNVKDLQIECFKGEVLLMEILKEARGIYNLKTPEAKEIGPFELRPKSTKISKNARMANQSNATRQPSHLTIMIEQEHTHHVNGTLTTARMLSEMTHINKQINVTNTEGVDVDSSSCDGGEFTLEDAYMLMEDRVNNDDNYNTEYMEKDSIYKDFLAGIQQDGL